MNQELLAGMSSEEQALLLEDAYVTTCSHIHNVHDVHDMHIASYEKRTHNRSDENLSVTFLGPEKSEYVPAGSRIQFWIERTSPTLGWCCSCHDQTAQFRALLICGYQKI